MKGVDEKEYLAPGHRACAGCGATIAARLALKALGENTIAVSATGCLEVITTPYPETAWEVPWIHVAFENAGAVASGVERALKAQGKEDVNVVAFGGDGGTADIGIGQYYQQWLKDKNSKSATNYCERGKNKSFEYSKLLFLFHPHNKHRDIKCVNRYDR